MNSNGSLSGRPEQILEKIAIPVKLDDRDQLIEASNTCASLHSSPCLAWLLPLALLCSRVAAAAFSTPEVVLCLALQSTQQQGRVTILVTAVAHGGRLRPESAGPCSAQQVCLRVFPRMLSNLWAHSFKQQRG